MGKPSKIIHILPHSPASSAYEAKAEDKAPKWKTSYADDSKNYEKIDFFPYWIGYYQNDHMDEKAPTICNMEAKFLYSSQNN